MAIWQQLTLIMQWYAETQSCDELSLHQGNNSATSSE